MVLADRTADHLHRERQLQHRPRALSRHQRRLHGRDPSRATLAADVGVLLINNASACGLASGIGSTAATAFAAVYWDCATGYYSFAHEIGHLHAARHDPENDPTTTPYAYGHGYQYTGSKNLAHDHGLRILRLFISDLLSNLPRGVRKRALGSPSRGGLEGAVGIRSEQEGCQEPAPWRGGGKPFANPHLSVRVLNLQVRPLSSAGPGWRGGGADSWGGARGGLGGARDVPARLGHGLLDQPPFVAATASW